MWSNFYITIILLVSCCCVPLHAQTCRVIVEGYVLDEHTGVPIVNANILVEEQRKGAVSDSSGYFRIEHVCPGDIHMTTSHVGCETQRQYIELDEDTTLYVFLDHYGHTLDHVVIEGSALTTQPGQSISTSTINEGGDKNLATLLEEVTGVRALQTGSGIAKPVIHGLYGNRISIINNELVQSGQQWGNDHNPEIDPFSAKKITVVKGASALAYSGTHMGGLVLVDAGDIPDEPHLHSKGGLFYESNGRGLGGHVQMERHGQTLAWRARPHSKGMATDRPLVIT